MPALAELQRAFRRALLEGEAAGIAPFVRPDGLTAAERLQVYRHNLVSSLTSLLEHTFPAVLRLVDERFFAYAAHEFLTSHPPEHACLADYGAAFSRFLASFPPCRELAYLADVAELEWLMHRAAQADAPALSVQALHGIAAKDTQHLVLQLHPALGLIASPWPIDRIWRANRPGSEGSEAIDLGAGGAWLEVRRSGADVVMRALSGASFAFRQALQAGARLDAAAEAALAEDASFDLAAALARLFGDGLVVALALPAAKDEG
ncbi:MAG: putative DNA-binding domain-containing protein [Alphaproteobacteria bacterium]